MAYSQDLRERVVAYVEEGNIQLSASQQFPLNPKTVREWLNLKEETDSRILDKFEHINDEIMALGSSYSNTRK